MAQPYDFVARVREEIELIQRELDEPGAHERLRAIAEELALPEQVALAAVYRAAKRSGYTLKVMTEELWRQLEAEQAGRIKQHS